MKRTALSHARCVRKCRSHQLREWRAPASGGGTRRSLRKPPSFCRQRPALAVTSAGPTQYSHGGSSSRLRCSTWVRAFEIAAVQPGASPRGRQGICLSAVQRSQQACCFPAPHADYRGVDEHHGLRGLSLARGLIGHRPQDVGTQRPVIRAVRRAETHHIIALRQPRLTGIVGGPPAQLSELGQRYVQPAPSRFVVGRLVEQLGDRPELLLGQREHRAAPGHIVHRTSQRDVQHRPTRAATPACCCAASACPRAG